MRTAWWRVSKRSPSSSSVIYPGAVRAHNTQQKKKGGRYICRKKIAARERRPHRRATTERAETHCWTRSETRLREKSEKRRPFGGAEDPVLRELARGNCSLCLWEEEGKKKERTANREGASVSSLGAREENGSTKVELEMYPRRRTQSRGGSSDARGSAPTAVTPSRCAALGSGPPRAGLCSGCSVRGTLCPLLQSVMPFEQCITQLTRRSITSLRASA